MARRVTRYHRVAVSDRTPSHLVITVHGIRTFGQWSSRLAALVRAESAEIRFIPYVYGYFSALAFAFPPARWLAVRHFRRLLERICEQHPGARIDIVAHSFGTHLVGWGLRRMSRAHPARIHTVILAGSVLKDTFRWDLLPSDRVRRVINECGTRDVPLILSQVCILFTGMAGRTGFAGMTGASLYNRFHHGGHSLYFTDAFMKEHWAPLLTSESTPAAVDVRKSPGPVDGLVQWAAQNAEIPKIAVYALAITLPIWQYSSALESREHQRKLAVARQLIARAVMPGEQQAELLPLAILLAATSYQYAPTPEAEAFLRRAVAEIARAEERLDLEDVGAIVVPSGEGLAAPLAAAGGRVIDVGHPPLRIAHGFGREFVSFSGDGRWLGVADDTLRVLDVVTGGEALRLMPPAASACGAAVREIEFSTDKSLLAAAGSDGAFVVWDLETKRALMTRHFGRAFDPDVDIARVACEEVVKGVSFTPDGTYVATALPDARVVVWRVRTGRAAATIREEATAVVFSSDGTLLVTGSPDGAIRVWDWKRRLEVARARIQAAIILLQFVPGDALLITASDDRTARLWDFGEVSGLYGYRRYREDEAGEPFARPWMPEPMKEMLRAGHDDEVTAVAASGDGRSMVTVAGGTVFRWRLAADAPTQESLVEQACHRATRNLTSDEWRAHLGSEPYHATCPGLR